MGVDWERHLSGINTNNSEVFHHFLTHENSTDYTYSRDHPVNEEWFSLMGPGRVLHEYWGSKESFSRDDFLLGEYTTGQFILIYPRKKMSGNRKVTILDSWISNDGKSLIEYLVNSKNISNLDGGVDNNLINLVISDFFPIWKWNLLENNQKRNFVFCPSSLNLEKIESLKSKNRISTNSDDFSLENFSTEMVFCEALIRKDLGPDSFFASYDIFQKLKIFSQQSNLEFANIVRLFLVEQGIDRTKVNLKPADEMVNRYKLKDRNGAFQLLFNDVNLIPHWIDVSLTIHGNSINPFNEVELDYLEQNVNQGRINSDWIDNYQKIILANQYDENIRLLTALWVLKTNKLQQRQITSNLGKLSLNTLLENIDQIKKLLPSTVDNEFYSFLVDLEGGGKNEERRRDIIENLFDQKFVTKSNQLMSLANYLGGFLSSQNFLTRDRNIVAKYVDPSLPKSITILNSNTQDMDEINQRIILNLNQIITDPNSDWKISNFMPTGMLGNFTFMYPILTKCASYGIRPPSDSRSLLDNLTPEHYFKLYKLEEENPSLRILSGKEKTSVHNGWTYPGYFEFEPKERKRALFQIATHILAGNSQLDRVVPNKQFTFHSLTIVYFLLTSISVWLSAEITMDDPSSLQNFSATSTALLPILISLILWISFGSEFNNDRFSKLSFGLALLLVPLLFVIYLLTTGLQIVPDEIPYREFSLLKTSFSIPDSPGAYLALLPLLRIIQTKLRGKIEQENIIQESHRKRVEDVLKGIVGR